jgi:hypothetical protein
MNGRFRNDALRRGTSGLPWSLHVCHRPRGNGIVLVMSPELRRFFEFIGRPFFRFAIPPAADIALLFSA